MFKREKPNQRKCKKCVKANRLSYQREHVGDRTWRANGSEVPSDERVKLSIADLQHSNPERFARQCERIRKGEIDLVPVSHSERGDGHGPILLQIDSGTKTVVRGCEAALIIYVREDHTIHSGCCGEKELIDRLRLYAIKNPMRVFEPDQVEIEQKNPIVWSCTVWLEPTSMKNSKIKGRFLSKDARIFKNVAQAQMKSNGVWANSSRFGVMDLVKMRCRVRYSTFRKDMDLELVKDCLQYAGIIPNDKLIFEEEFIREQKAGTPRIDITLTKIGTAGWK